MERTGGRAWNELRPVRLTPGYVKFPEGSVLIEMGDTRVLCNASVEHGVPSFLRGTGKGWLTAEYAMLPRATPQRTQREAARGRQGGRTLEIQRLIGRALRAVIDLTQLGERTLILDCDVIQADGGTRTAGITGAFVAATQALGVLVERGDLSKLPIVDGLAAVSVGMVDGELLLDLDYAEDSRAEVDFNVVATGAGRLVEVQGTAEGKPFGRDELELLIDLAMTGIGRLHALQAEVLGVLADSWRT